MSRYVRALWPEIYHRVCLYALVGSNVDILCSCRVTILRYDISQESPTSGVRVNHLMLEVNVTLDDTIPIRPSGAAKKKSFTSHFCGPLHGTFSIFRNPIFAAYTKRTVDVP